eukprot:4962715-Pyramimonas_sp.AAC.1
MHAHYVYPLLTTRILTGMRTRVPATVNKVIHDTLLPSHPFWSGVSGINYLTVPGAPDWHIRVSRGDAIPGGVSVRRAIHCVCARCWRRAWCKPTADSACNSALLSARTREAFGSIR